MKIGRHSVGDPLSRSPNLKHLIAVLAVTTRSSTRKRCVQALHPDPALRIAACQADQNTEKLLLQC